MISGLDLAERGLLPDPVVRWGIRRLLRERLQSLPTAASAVAQPDQDFLDVMRMAPIAIEMEAANEQHYEVPAQFFTEVLGPNLKYSCALFERGDESLVEAEEAMLALTCKRAELKNGQRILELGCGWGSLTLWMARHYPDSQIAAISNSNSQRQFVLTSARRLGLSNIQVQTVDMNRFATDQTYDRVVSVEMFEHMRNWERLLQRVSCWLVEDGKLFIHVFAHRDRSYPFESRTRRDWMAQHFFTGGMMPSHDLPRQLGGPLAVERSFRVNGRHYSATAEAWLRNLDTKRVTILPLLRQTYGTDAEIWFERWRLFFLSCAELFGYEQGQEWHVSHHLMVKRGRLLEPN